MPRLSHRHGPSRKARGSIVVVEPDALIRELVERWLREAGYDTQAADEHCANVSVAPRLVIADISDPLSAGATIEALRAAYCAPILVLSARFRRGLAGCVEPAERLRVERVLPKPFTRDELLVAVLELMHPASSAPHETSG